MFKLTDKYLKAYTVIIVCICLCSISIGIYADSYIVKSASVVITALSAFGIIIVVKMLLVEAVYLCDPKVDKEQNE